MITISILAILGVCLVTVLVAMFRAPGGRPANRTVTAGAQTPQVSAPMPDELDPWDARKGDVISINGAADDYSDVDFPIDRRSAYEAHNRRWVDLSGEYRGTRVYLEVYKYPQSDLIGILSPRKLALTDIGVTEEQLADIDSHQTQDDFIQFEGKQWHWESSREIGYFENERGEGEGLYRWLFAEPGGRRLLCIEKWEDEPFEVRIACRLSGSDVTIYRAA
jgi:hypothetical protein